MGRRRHNILNQEKKGKVEAYNLGNRLAERSNKNIGAKLLLEQKYRSKITLGTEMQPLFLPQ